MGKNRTIKILGGIIGNIVVHKILIKHTNKPESVSHMTKEVGVYGENASEIAQEFNWNDKDKIKIHEEAIKKFKNNIEKYYSDVIFPENEVLILIDETIEEFI
jgi:cupin superfamily acireductone dioxygenase involved in methionine salvage